LGAFGSIKTNNLFVFTALLVYGAAVSGVKPASSYPFLLFMGILLLFPLSSDPLARIPRSRSAVWPLDARQRLALRLGGGFFNPMLWLAMLLLFKTAPSLLLAFLATTIAVQYVASKDSGRGFRLRTPVPGRMLLASNALRQMLSILDTYAALLFSIGGCAYRLLSPRPAPAAFPILSMLVALTLSSYAQCLFGLDSSSAITRGRLLPLRGWRILAAKDAAFLAVLFLLALPLSPGPGMTFGLTALAIGHFPSVGRREPQYRWRFTGGKVATGVALAAVALALASAESRHGPVFLGAAAALYISSLMILQDRGTPAMRVP
jgi:hypothetical protein